MLTVIEKLLRESALPHRVYAGMPAPVRKVMLNARALSLLRLRYSGEAYSALNSLMERDSWSAEKLALHVAEAEASLLRDALKIPYYRDAASSCGRTGGFPVLTRDIVKRKAALMVHPEKKGLIRVFTSGSSGSGLPVVYDKSAYSLNWAYRMKHCLWAGVKPRDWRVTFFGSRIVPVEHTAPPFWMANHVERQHLVSIFHLVEKNAVHYVRFLDEHQGLVLEGFPTVLSLMARYVKEGKGRMQYKAVFSSGEPLYPSMRKEIEEAFGAKVYDAYGMTEWAGLILECERGGYHALSDYGALEVLREDGSPAARGEEGYFAWTGFTNRAMPFIRYRIGDRGVWAGGSCSCGRPYPLVNPTVTRDSDYLITPSGRILSPRAVNQVLKDKLSFHACQFIQVRPDEVVVRIVPVGGMDFRKDLNDLKRDLEALMGGGVKIGEEIAEEPLRRGNRGKIPLIISGTPLCAEDGKRAEGEHHV